VHGRAQEQIERTGHHAFGGVLHAHHTELGRARRGGVEHLVEVGAVDEVGGTAEELDGCLLAKGALRPSTATRCGVSSARQADMISRQMEATCWLSSGPWLDAWIFSITWATRSGRKKGEPSWRLSSPTASATRARSLSRDSSCWSSESI